MYAQRRRQYGYQQPQQLGGFSLSHIVHSINHAVVSLATAPLKIVAPNIADKIVSTTDKLSDKAFDIARTALPIVATVASFIPVLAPIALPLRAAMIAQQLAAKAQDARVAKAAQREYDQQRGNAIDNLVGQGLARDEATSVVDQVANGVDPQVAVQSVLARRPQTAAPSAGGAAPADAGSSATPLLLTGIIGFLSL